MRQVLEAKGWKKFFECNCGGSLRQHFSNKEKPGYEIVIRPTKNTFRVLLSNRVIGGPYWGYDLEKKMEELIS